MKFFLNIKYKILGAIILGLLFVSCESSYKKKSSHYTPPIRHGWRVFSGPKPTKVYSTKEVSIDNGQKLYEKHCLKCHGKKGLGDGPKAAHLKTKPANLTAFKKDQSRYFIYFQMNDSSKKEMPNWKEILTPKEASELSHYVMSLSQ